MRLLSVLLVGSLFALISCKSSPKNGASREPSAAAAPVEHNHSAPDDIANSADFKAFEEERRHTFVIADNKGHFGSHFTEFQSGHQHQVFVKMKITRKGFAEKDMQALFAEQPTSKLEKYFSITTNPPRVTIRSIFTAPMPFKVPKGGTLYDGLIAQQVLEDGITPNPDDNSFQLDKNAGLTIEKVLYTHPMIVSEQALVNSTHILFGSYGADKGAKTEYSMAHLIQGADNYEQLMRVTLSEAIAFDDYAMLSLDIPDKQALEVGRTYDATLKDGKNVKVTVNREFYIEMRRRK